FAPARSGPFGLPPNAGLSPTDRTAAAPVSEGQVAFRPLLASHCFVRPGPLLVLCDALEDTGVAPSAKCAARALNHRAASFRAHEIDARLRATYPEPNIHPSSRRPAANRPAAVPRRADSAFPRCPDIRSSGSCAQRACCCDRSPLLGPARLGRRTVLDARRAVCRPVAHALPTQPGGSSFLLPPAPSRTCPRRDPDR